MRENKLSSAGERNKSLDQDSSRALMQSVFRSLEILDVGSWIAGPVAATIMADYGADVIKVEMPGVGISTDCCRQSRVVPDADEILSELGYAAD